MVESARKHSGFEDKVDGGDSGVMSVSSGSYEHSVSSEWEGSNS